MRLLALLEGWIIVGLSGWISYFNFKYTAIAVVFILSLISMCMWTVITILDEISDGR